MIRLTLAAFLVALGSGAASAADSRTVPAPQQEGPTVPGGDIFGFTSSSDTGDAGDRGIAFETTSRAGRMDGRYWSTTLKTQFAATIAPNLAVALSPFVTYHRVRDFTGLDNRNSTAFDGLSGEITWRFLPRGPSGIAAAVSVEPRWARVDAASGARVDAYGAEFKLFVDAVVIPDTLFAALNLNYAPGTARFAGQGNGWVQSSGTNVSAALAWQLSPTLFVGAEARLLAAFDGAFLNRRLGSALHVGPNLLYRLTDKAALNIAWTPQVSGDARGVADSLDLTNFERHQLRVKLSIGL